MRWILDDGPFDCMARVLEPERVSGWKPGWLLVAPTTAKDAAQSEPRRALLEARSRDRDQEVIGSFEIFHGTGDPAAGILAELHGGSESTDDLAERESIAWALTHDPDAVLVTGDKRAALTALAELGRGRVAHPFELWIELLEAELIDRDGFEELCRWTKNADQGLTRTPGRVSAALAKAER
jgi:hypothetical protein